MMVMMGGDGGGDSGVEKPRHLVGGRETVRRCDKNGTVPVASVSHSLSHLLIFSFSSRRQRFLSPIRREQV